MSAAHGWPLQAIMTSGTVGVDTPRLCPPPPCNQQPCSPSPPLTLHGWPCRTGHLPLPHLCLAFPRPVCIAPSATHPTAFSHVLLNPSGLQGRGVPHLVWRGEGADIRIQTDGASRARNIEYRKGKETGGSSTCLEALGRGQSFWVQAWSKLQGRACSPGSRAVDAKSHAHCGGQPRVRFL